MHSCTSFFPIKLQAHSFYFNYFWFTLVFTELESVEWRTLNMSADSTWKSSAHSIVSLLPNEEKYVSAYSQYENIQN